MKRFVIFIIINSLLLTFGFAQNSSELSILSWNIRDFGKTKNSEEIAQIADIIKDFDLVAIQEVVAIDPGGAQAIGKLADELNRRGAKWDYRVSNPTASPPYKTERYAFLWKTHKLQNYTHIDLVDELSTIVYREPYYGIFILKDFKLHILNYHSRRYNEDPEVEVEAIGNYIINDNNDVSILAGDFNLKENHYAFNILYQNNFASVINNLKTTLKRECKNGVYTNINIDNIYVSTRIYEILASGTIDFVSECDNLATARLISDHLPVYVTLKIK